jgi:hypothetical protein
VRKGIKEFGEELEEIAEVVSGVISDFKRMEQWERFGHKQQVSFSKISNLEEDRKRSNIMIFGLEKGKERYDNAVEVVKEVLKEIVRLGILVSNIDHIASIQ